MSKELALSVMCKSEMVKNSMVCLHFGKQLYISSDVLMMSSLLQGKLQDECSLLQAFT